MVSAARRDAATATLMRSIGEALFTYAAALDGEAPQPAPARRAPAKKAAPRAGGLGKNQRAIVELRGLATDDGMTTGDIAKAIGYSYANTANALKSLEAKGVIEQVEDVRPAHWRIAD